MFSDKGSKLSNLWISTLITTFEKKSFSFTRAFSSFVIRFSSFSASFNISEDWTLFEKKNLKVFQKHLFLVKLEKQYFFCFY